jgi:hypothetical protein
MRKTNLARLLARRPDGIFVAPFEQGEIGPDLFRAACDMGLERLVSKRRDRPHQASRSKGVSGDTACAVHREAAARLSEVDPMFTMTSFIARGNFSNMKLLIEGLRKAGLPE